MHAIWVATKWPGMSGRFFRSPKDVRVLVGVVGAVVAVGVWRHRLAIMAEALERAHASENWDRSPGTLKVFLAPEFYWRGAKGALHAARAHAIHLDRPFLSFRCLPHFNKIHQCLVACDQGDLNSVGLKRAVECACAGCVFTSKG